MLFFGNNKNVFWTSTSFIKLTFPRYLLPPIVPSLLVHSFQRFLSCCLPRKQPHIPQFNALIFAVWNQMSTVAPGIYERDAVHMASQYSDRLWRALVQSSSIPHFDQTIISTTINNMGRVISKNYTIYIVFMGWNLET